jgi:hypothetical protein
MESYRSGKTQATAFAKTHEKSILEETETRIAAGYMGNHPGQSQAK